jgi:transglutaminase-like putative cysteine protease
LGLLGLAMAATLFTHRTLLGQEAGVTFIVVLLALKTLEMRARRDAMVVFFLGFFTMLSNFFHSQSLLTAASMLVALLGLLTALVNSHMPVGRPPFMQVAKTATRMALLGAPIMLALFMLFPRLAPLWGVPTDTTRARSGLSERMQVGNIASLALDSSVAMRVQFDGPPPRQSAMYFRGPVLTNFDGREWRPLYSSYIPAQQVGSDLEVQGEAVRYQITLEANRRPWLLVLDATADKPDISGYKPVMTTDLQWVAERALADLVRYRAVSYPTFRYGASLTAPKLRSALALPAGFNPRTLQLAQAMRNDPLYANADASTLVRAVMQRLRTGGYSYTLEPGVFGVHTADEFWFDRKEGFCEHIASSFVLLMRALGVPARVVTGYQGGESNSVDGLWTVRQSDAHAWAEVWIEGQGWVRVDPTSAVAPGRTGSLQRLEPPSNVFTQAMGAVNPKFVLNLRSLWDAANNRWNQWVLNYTQTQQLNLLRNLGFESPSWQDLVYVLIGLVVLASLGGAVWTLWERHHQDPWLRLLHRAAKQLQHAGIALPPQASPRQMAQLLQAHDRVGESKARHDPQLSTDWVAVTAWLLKLEAWRYSHHANSGPQALRTLQREYRQLRWPTR